MKKLSKRLGALFEWGLKVNASHIYDLCCDHALLAKAFWRETNAQVYAVDQIPHIIQEHSSYGDSRFQALCSPAQKVRYEADSLLILAGVGAYTSKEILKAFLKQGVLKSDIIICCHQHIEILRKFLKEETGLKLCEEKLLFEKKQFYQLLWLSFRGKREISYLGDEIWSGEDKESLRRYYKQQMTYWEKNRSVDGALWRDRYKAMEKPWLL